jgi:hypothetical protein
MPRRLVDTPHQCRAARASLSNGEPLPRPVPRQGRGVAHGLLVRVAAVSVVIVRIGGD